MKEIYSIYLSVLRSFVKGTAPEKVTAENWQKMLELAHINNTKGILCHVYMSHPDLVPEEIRPFLRRQCLQEVAVYAQRAEAMKQLAEVFDENEIPCVFFKGFVVREYYPVPELRTFGDVDFLIRKEDREKSDALMKTLGYMPKDTWEPAYSYIKGNEHYEIHTDVMEIDVSDKADYISYFSHVWEHTRPAEVVNLSHGLEFTPEFHFLYLLTHIAKHISGSGAGVRMYLDLAFFIKRFEGGMDWNWITTELEKLSLSDFANMALSAVEAWFDVVSPLPLRPVEADILADFLDFTLSGGVYGYVGREKGLVFLKQQNPNEEQVSKGKTLLYHVFPPVGSMKNRYTYLQKQPWLLPVAWGHRLVVSRKEWGRFARNTKEILTADEAEVRKLKRIYKELGL